MSEIIVGIIIILFTLELVVAPFLLPDVKTYWVIKVIPNTINKLFENKNAFGKCLAMVVTIILLPCFVWIVFFQVIQLLVIGLKAMWYLGCKR